MTLDKGLWIEDIIDGQNVRGTFLVRQMGRAETRAGKPYLTLTLMDRTGEMAARVWDNADELAPRCPAGSFVTVTAQAQAYKNVVQLKVNDLATVPAAELDPALFMPATPADIPSLKKEIQAIIDGLEHPDLQALLRVIFKDPELARQFTKAPAAKHMHHAYIGGLLEHTVAVARLAVQACDSYPELDRPLLLCGALLHDIGKTSEFTFDVFPFDYSNQGRLMGHLVLGVETVQSALADLPDFPEDLADRLKHLILSHHGRHEFGSPSLPMTAEAFVLNLLDDLDAKMNYLGRLGTQAKGPGYQWSDFQPTMERFLFVHGHEASGEADTPTTRKEKPPVAAEQNDSDPRKQTSLW
jgi:3'-5' exoribonuclease